MDTKNKTSSLSWKANSEELKYQVENYKTLKITESYRGVAILIISALLLLSLVLAFFGIYASISDILLGLIIYIPILIFVYKGHRWAMVFLIILWTIEKIYSASLALEQGGSVIGSIIWWLLITPYLYKALKVENEWRKYAKPEHKENSGVFCTKCGLKNEIGGKFCTRCGNSIN